MYAMLVLWIVAFISPSAPPESLQGQHENLSVNSILDVKSDAYEILRSKCNVCHERRNPSKVFTLDNMNKFAEQIYKQVFIKKRMPQGREIKLTPEEFERLRKWLTQNE